MPGTYTGADSVVLIEEALNADQLNAPNYKNIPHLVAWNLSSYSLQYVNTLSNVIDKEIFDGAFSGYRNYVVVDAVYGDDNIASTDPYKASYSFSTIQGAIDNTGDGDLIVVNPGNYVLVSSILLTQNKNFYFFPNTIVQDNGKIGKGMFLIQNCIVNIYGYADFILNTNKSRAFDYTNNVGLRAKLYFNCNKITILDESLAFNISNTNLTINILQEADCSNISGCRFLLLSSIIQDNLVTINSPIIKHSGNAYNVSGSSGDGILIVNVKNTISYDNASSQTIIVASTTNFRVFLNGDVNSAQTQNNAGLGVFTIIQDCVSCSIIVNGGTCSVRNRSIFRCIGLNCIIRINANITNTQASGDIGLMQGDSRVYLAGRFQAVIGVQSILIGGGTPRAVIVLEYGSLITKAGNPSIANNVVGFNMFYCSYFGATNNAPQVTTTPLASQLIVNPLVQ